MANSSPRVTQFSVVDQDGNHHEAELIQVRRAEHGRDGHVLRKGDAVFIGGQKAEVAIAGDDISFTLPGRAGVFRFAEPPENVIPT